MFLEALGWVGIEIRVLEEVQLVILMGQEKRNVSMSIIFAKQIWIR